MKLSEKLKKLSGADSEPPQNVSILKVAMNLLQRVFFKFAESFILAC